MKKTLCALLIVSSSLSAFSQTDNLDQLADQVKELINVNGSKLDNEDQASVKKNLRQIIQLFKLNGYEVGTSRNFFCDSNNNQLIDSDNARMIHDFSDYGVCMEALNNVKAGKSFCDYDGNILYRPNGMLIHDFSDYNNCRDAIESIARVKKYCDYANNTLRKADGTLIHDFSSLDECLRNLK